MQKSVCIQGRYIYIFLVVIYFTAFLLLKSDSLFIMNTDLNQLRQGDFIAGTEIAPKTEVA